MLGQGASDEREEMIFAKRFALSGAVSSGSVALGRPLGRYIWRIARGACHVNSTGARIDRIGAIMNLWGLMQGSKGGRELRVACESRAVSSDARMGERKLDGRMPRDVES